MLTYLQLLNYFIINMCNLQNKMGVKQWRKRGGWEGRKKPENMLGWVTW